MFEVIDYIGGVGLDYIKSYSYHVTEHRKNRLLILSDVFAVFEVNTGRCGTDYHFILDNAKILIVNKQSRKCITILNARPPQIKKYFKDFGCPNTRSFQKLLKNAVRNKIRKEYKK